MSSMRALVTVPERRSFSTKMPDRRRVMRRGVKIGVEAVAEDGFRLLGRSALDLSPDGMLLETRGAYARIGEEVFVSFRPPHSRMWIDAVARVTRLVKGRRRSDREQAVGLRFVAIESADRAFLAAKLRGHPPPIPGRHQPIDYAAMVRAIALS